MRKFHFSEEDLQVFAHDRYHHPHPLVQRKVCELLRQIAASHGGTLVTLVLDNARYQRCRLVQDLAEELNIELLFLPSYSPNLNLIERLWRFVKKKALYSNYYKTYDEFQQAIDQCLDGLTTRYWDDIEQLMTHRFQTFTNVPFLTE